MPTAARFSRSFPDAHGLVATSLLAHEADTPLVVAQLTPYRRTIGAVATDDDMVPDDDLVAAVGVTLAAVALGVATGALAGVAAFAHRLKRASRSDWPHPV